MRDDASLYAADGRALIESDLALQVLDDVIMTRWKVLPREQCLGDSFKLAAIVKPL